MENKLLGDQKVEEEIKERTKALVGKIEVNNTDLLFKIFVTVSETRALTQVNQDILIKLAEKANIVFTPKDPDQFGTLSPADYAVVMYKLDILDSLEYMDKKERPMLNI